MRSCPRSRMRSPRDRMDRSLAEKGWMFSTWLDPVGGHGPGLHRLVPIAPDVPMPSLPLQHRAAAVSPPSLTVLAPDDVSNSDTPDLRVTEAEQEGPVRLRAQELADVLLADEADDEPRGTGRWGVGQGQGGEVGPGQPAWPLGTHRSDQ